MVARRTFLAGSAASLAGLALARGADGTFELVAGPSRARLYAADGEESPVWAYNGRLPGPTIRVRQGERVRVRFVNRLDEPTSVHWHGIRIDNTMDGVAGLTQPAVPPGGEFEYDFEVPDAGTYWYHAHNRSWNQVGRGLYGPLIVDEPDPAYLSERDLCLIIDDWRLTEAGVLDTASFGSLHDWSHGGRLGNWPTVNGQPQPSLTLARGVPHRLRLVNASNARVFELDPGRFAAHVIALDGQPLPEPLTASRALGSIAPAQRMDLLVVPTGDFAIEELTGGGAFPLVRFRVSGPEPTAPTPRPRPLPAAGLPRPDLGAAATVRLVMAGGAMGGPVSIVHKGRTLSREDLRRTRQVWALNGVADLAAEPLFDVRRGETVVLEMINETAWPHAMHLHGHHFRVLTESAAHPPGAWRDTVLIGPRESVRIAFVADNPGRWLLHCHMLEHAAAGMRTWFRVG